MWVIEFYDPYHLPGEEAITRIYVKTPTDRDKWINNPNYLRSYWDKTLWHMRET